MPSFGAFSTPETPVSRCPAPVPGMSLVVVDQQDAGFGTDGAWGWLPWNALYRSRIERRGETSHCPASRSGFLPSQKADFFHSSRTGFPLIWPTFQLEGTLPAPIKTKPASQASAGVAMEQTSAKPLLQATPNHLQLLLRLAALQAPKEKTSPELSLTQNFPGRDSNLRPIRLTADALTLQLRGLWLGRTSGSARPAARGEGLLQLLSQRHRPAAGPRNGLLGPSKPGADRQTRRVLRKAIGVNPERPGHGWRGPVFAHQAAESASAPPAGW